jgi:ABC-type transporter Mla subunit MlaD
VQRERSRPFLREAHWVLDHPWFFVAAVVAVAFVAWIASTRSQPYHVRAEFATAFNLVPGLPVDVDGQQVGMVSGVQYVNGGADGSAIVDIGISDPRYYPLHAGTTVESRWGSTIGNGTRRLDLVPGPITEPKIPNGGIIVAQDTTPAVDLDQVLNALNTSTRAHLTGMVSNLGAGVNGEAHAIHAAINSSPPAFAAANSVLSDLAVNTYALQALITNGDRLTAILDQRAPAIEGLVSAAGQTFAATAAHANGLQQSIQDLPGALTSARATLAQLDGSVNTLTTLITDIKPGAAVLSPLAASMRPALAELRSIVPTGVQTLRQATASAPSISALLQVGAPFMPKLGSVTSQLAPMIACVRPYAPEAGSAIVGAGDWMSTYVKVLPNATPGVTPIGPTDGAYVDQHGVRAMPEVSLGSDHANVGMSTQAFVAASGKAYAEPRPPGLSVGQPWYLPQCGAGPNSTNPADDPENPNK